LCNFDIPGLDSSPLPVFLGEIGKLIQIFAQNVMMPSFGALSSPNSSTRESALHFGEKHASLPLPIFQEPWQMRCPPSGLPLAMEYREIAAFQFFVGSLQLER